MKKLSLALLLLPILALGYTYTVDQSQVELVESNGYIIPTLTGAAYTNDIGAPRLPWLPIHVACPAGMIAAEVEILDYQSIELPGTHVVFPTQESRPISQPAAFAENFDPAIYEGDGVYPAVPLEARGGGNLAGYGVADLVFCPVIYHPASGRLELITSIDFNIVYDSRTAGIRTPTVLTTHAAEIGRERVQSLVINPEEVMVPAPVKASTPPGVEPRSTINEPMVGDTAEWVLITDPSFVTAFEPLVEWKLQKGLTTAVVTTDYIQSTYSGTDMPEKIRNFIIDAFTNWSTVYVVLGGDTAYVRERRAWISFGSYDDNMIPCDLYYSDLDHTWNVDGDNKWGEYIADQPLDYYGDVYVSRLPVNNTGEVTAVVNKILTYEKSVPADFPTTTIFFAGKLDNIPTWGGDGLDYIGDNYLPAELTPFTAYYERDGSYTDADIIADYEAGESAVVNQLHHSNYSVIGAGNNTYISTDEAYAMTNGDYQGWMYIQGCMSGGFDRARCVCEGLVVNPTGGSVATMANSRYGLYSPGDAPNGESNLYDARFFEAVFNEGFTEFGVAQTWSKDYYVPQAGNTYMRWVMYVQNVLGPCQTRSWVDSPASLAVQHPDTWYGGDFTVSVQTVTAAPINGATVCVYMEDSVFQTAQTDSSGQADFTLTGEIHGDLYVTVDMPQYYPYQGTCDCDYSAVDVVSFDGAATEDGALVRWEIADDGTFAGLDIYRGSERLNDVSLNSTSGGYLDVTAAGRNDYYLEITEADGGSFRVGPVSIMMPEGALSRSLSGAYPNPARAAAGFELTLPEAEHVELAVYDLSGRRVATLASGELSAGRHLINWDCSGTAEGVYLARLQAGGEVLTSRLVIAR